MLTEINIPAVLLAAFINFSVVTLWFSPALFGPLWLRSLGKDIQNVQNIITLQSLAIVFLFLILFNCGLELAANLTRTVGMSDGIILGLTVWFFISFAQIAVIFAMEQRSKILIALYSGLFLFISVISSALFAMWR